MFDNIKPASTRKADPESKVVEGNKQTYAGTLGSTGGVSGAKPTGLFSVSGTMAKESSSTKECKVLHERIIQESYDGVISWEYTVDDSHQQEKGLDLKELGTLPCVSCEFEGSSDDAPPPPAPDLFGVQVMSCWSLISMKRKPHTFFGSLFSFGSSQMKPPTFSNLCQFMLLDLPSQLSKDSYYKAVGKATPASAMPFHVIHSSRHEFDHYINFSSPRGGAI